MGSDRELTDLAAKAVGIELVVDYNTGHPKYDSGAGSFTIWRPIDDTSQAFLLALKLGMKLCLGDGFVVTDNEGPDELHWDFDESSIESVRRAIVSGAAYIGSKL